MFPTKVKYISPKRLCKPWISSGILNSIKTKSRYFKLCKIGVIDEELNRRYRNCLNATIRLAKRNYYINSFNSCQNNIKKTWGLIKQLLSKKSKDNKIRNIVVNNANISNNLQIAEHFNNYFADIAQTLNNQVPTTNEDPYHTVTNNNVSSIFFYPVTAMEVENIISNLKNTASNLNEIPVKFLKNLSTILSEPISNLVNASFSSGVFPECLKCAKIVPIYKKGDPKDISNYRPISLLPTLSKIFERCISRRLLDFFSKFDIISHRQFGFQKGRSTTDAFLALVEYIYDCLNGKEHCIGIFVDFKKAFDTVNHDILLGKLERYGVRGLPLRLIASYLRDRRHYVAIDGQGSAQRTINIGVPQGSILGPILFLIYINDLTNISTTLWPVLYADDTTLLAKNSDYPDLVQSLNVELPKFYRWTTVNRLSISHDKTYKMLFTNRDCSLLNGSIYLNNVLVKSKISEEFLGLVLDDKLKFAKHIDIVCNKLSKTVGLLYKLKDHVPCKTLINLYYSLAYPYLLYANLVWGGGGTCQEYLTPLVILQKKMIRIINNADYLAHTGPLFKKNSILTLNDLHRFILAQYMFKRKMSNDTMFESIHEYNTRGRNNAQQSFQRLTQTQLSVSFAGPKIWNALPLYVRSSNNISEFKKQLKKYYIAMYS